MKYAEEISPIENIDQRAEEKLKHLGEVKEDGKKCPFLFSQYFHTP